jgi:hypothetical protein
MKKRLGLVIAVLFAMSLAGCSAVSGPGAAGPTLAGGLSARLDNAGKIELSGSGFKKGMEIHLLLTTDDGVQSNIDYALDPQPLADANGSWRSTWSYGRFVKKKLVKEGTYPLVVVDEDYRTLARTTVTFTK